MEKILSKTEFGKMVRFLIIGIAATAVDLLVSFIFLSLIGDNLYSHLVENFWIEDHIRIILKQSFEEVVSVVAFCVAFVVSFFGHSSFSFKKKRNLSVLLRLLAVNVSALCLRVLIIYLIKTKCGINGYVPVVSAMVIVTALSYLCSRFWVFNKAQDVAVVR